MQGKQDKYDKFNTIMRNEYERVMKYKNETDTAASKIISEIDMLREKRNKHKNIINRLNKNIPPVPFDSEGNFIPYTKDQLLKDRQIHKHMLLAIKYNEKITDLSQKLKTLINERESEAIKGKNIADMMEQNLIKLIKQNISSEFGKQLSNKKAITKK